MSLLQPLGTGQGYAKAGFLGFQGSGKSWTATELALGIRTFFGIESPIAFFDTEGGSEYIADRVKRETGMDLIGVRARSFQDLIATAQEVEKEGIKVFIVDSVTHPWRELCDSWLDQVNAKRAEKRLPRRYNLEFQDWNPIKARWAKWTDWYLNSPVHVIICGRAGYEYDKVENDETKRKELVKTGIKMKAEGEFGFEPSLVVEMEVVQQLEPERRIIRRATVLKDRFTVLDGQSCDNPTFEFFRPHVALLTPNAHAPVDTSLKTDHDVSEEGEDRWTREKKARVIFSEEIAGELRALYPGETKDEKHARQEILFDLFGTRSWTKVESTDSGKLNAGLDKLRTMIEEGKFADAPGAPKVTEEATA